MLMMAALILANILWPHQSGARYCVNPSIAEERLQTDEEISVSVVEPGVHDSIEVRQVGCASPTPIIVYGDERLLADLVDLHMRRSGKVAHARIIGRLELPSYPPNDVGPKFVYFRVQKISAMWLEAPIRNGG